MGDDDPTTNAVCRSKYSRMTCGSKKLAKKETLDEMIYRERFNDAEIEKTLRMEGGVEKK